MSKHHRCKLRNANIHERQSPFLSRRTNLLTATLMTKLNLKAYLQNDRQILKPSHPQIDAFAATVDQIESFSFLPYYQSRRKKTQTIDKETNIYKFETYFLENTYLTFIRIHFFSPIRDNILQLYH